MARIILHNGTTALVDDDMYDELNRHSWTFKSRRSGSGYAIRSVKDENGKRRTLYMHRHIAGTPDGLLTDHINGDPLDNRRCNLRHVDKRQNGMNRQSNRGSTSQYIGVSFIQRYQKWCAQIKSGDRIINLGYFSDEGEAARARDKATRIHFGEYGRLNFPNEG